MNEKHGHDAERTLDVQDDDVAPIESDGDLHDAEDSPVEPDEQMSLQARREAARLHGDVFMVRSDLEDADQRESTPGVREQD